MPEARPFSSFPEALRYVSDNLPEIILPAAIKGAARIKSEILLNLSGRVLNQRSGDLYRSVSARARTDRDGLLLTVGSGGPSIPYAVIHEYGGQTGRGGKTHIRARPYVLPAIDEDEGRMFEEIGEAITEALIYGRRR